MCTLILFLCFMGTQIFLNPFLLLSWMVEHDCLDTCCFGRLMYVCCIFLYLHLFSANCFTGKCGIEIKPLLLLPFDTSYSGFVFRISGSLHSAYRGSGCLSQSQP